MHPFVNTAVKAARAAGKAIMQAQERLDVIAIAEKGKHDLVTEADHKSEAIIIDIIHTAYPDHDIIAEESGHHAREAEYTWIIDPIDGTMNFAHGFPYFCISIACMHQGRVEHAVIYNPNNDDLFTASRGQGAQKNNRRIRMAARTKLDDAMVATGLPAYVRDRRREYQTVLDQITPVVASLRCTGSAALDLAYTASGQIDAYWEFGLKPWDVAAGSLIVKEAGGIVTDPKGGDDYLKNGHIIAANPKLFKPFLDLIKPHLPADTY